MAEELPSINDFLEDKSKLPSVDTITEEALPSYKDFIEPKEEVITEEIEPRVIEERQDTKVIVSLIESIRDSIPEVKSYDKELYELMNLIEEVRKEIPVVPEPPVIPEVKYYDEEIQELKESIPVVPEVRYYEEEIQGLQEEIKQVKDRDIPDFRWISKGFNSLDENFETLDSSLATLRGKLDREISDIVESIETKTFEDKIDFRRLDKRVDDSEESLTEAKKEIASTVVEIKDKIYQDLREASLKIWKLNKEYKNDDKELKKQIGEQYTKLKGNIEESIKLSDSKIDTVNDYFNSLKEEIGLLPEVKYYDEEIKQVNKSVQSVKNLVEQLENKLTKKIAGLKESILVVPPTEDNSDPLTPLDKNFATLEDLSSHYRLFLNRIQQQLSTLGGGGEVNLRYLDDIVGVATNLSAYNGKYLKIDTSNSAQPFKFDTAGGGGSYNGTVGQLLQHDGSDFAGVSSVGMATYFNDYHQGYYRYSTHYYTTGTANTTQSLPADEFVMLQPAVRTTKDFLPLKMITANSSNPWIGTGATVGSGQTEFSLAGLSSDSTCILRIATSFNPDIDHTNLDMRVTFTTSYANQVAGGSTNFSITREQALICNEGADQDYISETLLNFYVGNSLTGIGTTDAGSFNIQARASDEGEIEVMALTLNVVA